MKGNMAYRDDVVIWLRRMKGNMVKGDGVVIWLGE
jgi:hypothetical protein